jgi:phenol hydroxylase P0 protein
MILLVITRIYRYFPVLPAYAGTLPATQRTQDRKHSMMTHHHLAPDAAGAQAPEEVLRCDTSKRFVRVTAKRPDGLVQFEFAIGWPDLAVELAMPQAMFDDFCARNGVTLLPTEQAPQKLGQDGDDE